MKVPHVIIQILAGLVAAFVCLLAVTVLSEQAGSLTLPKAFVILSGSMEPRIPTGSVVLTIPELSYFVGEAITFSSDNSGRNLVTHRITSVTDNPEVVFGNATYQTKGDANESADFTTVNGGDVVGRVVLTIPYLGYAIDFTKKPHGFILLVVVPATIIIYEETKSIIRQLGRVIKLITATNSRGRENLSQASVASLSNSGVRAVHIIKILAVALPVSASLMLLAGAANSLFYDYEVAASNLFGAAASFAGRQTEPDFDKPQELPSTPLPLFIEPFESTHSATQSATP